MPHSVTLYLVRHAIAAERGDAYPNDAKRPLTSEGMSRFRKAVKGLAGLDVRLDVILTSPLLRARQTAELLAEGLSGKPPIQEVDALSPGHSPAAVLEALSAFARHARVAVVGHEPDLGELAARLIGSRAAIPFRKGGVCCIEVAALPPTGPGVLEWFAPPRLLRKLEG